MSISNIWRYMLFFQHISYCCLSFISASCGNQYSILQNQFNHLEKSIHLLRFSWGNMTARTQFIVWIPKSSNHFENWIALSTVISFNKIVLEALLQVHFVQNQLKFLLIADIASQNSESLLEIFNLLRLQNKVKINWNHKVHTIM